MPGLLDLFGTNDQQPSYGGGLSNMSNSLIGMGMGLMTPYNAWKGESPYSNALQGFMTGSVADQRRQQQQQELAMQRQRMALAQAQAKRQESQWQQEFDLRKQQFDAGGWQKGTLKDPNTEQEYPYEYHTRSGEYRWPFGRPGYLGGQTAAPPTNTVVPGTSLYWPSAGDQPSTTGAGGVAAPAGQPELPPELQNAPPSIRREYWKKMADRAAAGPTAHEQGAIEKADDAVTANRAAINILTYAKQLSPKAPSGALAGLSDQVGQALPGYMSDETKARIELKNTVMTNAVEHLRAIFGGNPTEGERKILIELQGSIDQPDAIRQKIFDRAIEAANRRMEQNRQRGEQIRGGTYYRPGGGQSSAPTSPAPSTGGGGVVRWGRDENGNPVRLGQ